MTKNNTKDDARRMLQQMICPYLPCNNKKEKHSPIPNDQVSIESIDQNEMDFYAVPGVRLRFTVSLVNSDGRLGRGRKRERAKMRRRERERAEKKMRKPAATVDERLSFVFVSSFVSFRRVFALVSAAISQTPTAEHDAKKK